MRFKLDTKLYKIAFVAFIVFLVFFSSQIIAKTAYANDIAKSAEDVKRIEEQYRKHIGQKKLAYPLAKRGHELLQSNSLNLAIINLERAAQINPQYRDAWILLGFAYLKNREPQRALEAAQKAEKLDPINPQTYELLSLVYSSLDKTELAQKAKEKQEYLTK